MVARARFCIALLCLIAAGGMASARPAALPEVEVRGRGALTMVLIPCMSCRWSSWEPFMARNADRWRMYAVTLPGFGGTPVPALPMNGDSAVWHDQAVAAVVQLLDERDLRDVVLVGHSFGSAIALQVAARLPSRVRALVNVDGPLTSPRTWFPDLAEARVQAAQKLTADNETRYTEAEAWRVFNAPAPLRPDRQTLYHGMFMATPRAVVFQYWRENLLRDLNPILHALSRPVLDIKAISSTVSEPESQRARHLEQMRASNAPPSVRTVFFYNTGHFVHEEHPELLERAIVDFIDVGDVKDARPPSPRVALPGRFGHVERAGAGPRPMILMPCLGCDWRAFDEYMQRNAPKYRMYAVTWPGMGDTPLPRVPGRGTPLLDNVGKAIYELIQSEKLDRPVLVGHSAAGPVAIKFAADHPNLLGAVITVDATIQNDTTLGFTQSLRDEWADAEMADVLRRYDDDGAWLELNTVKPEATRTPERAHMYQAMWRTPPRHHVIRYWREWLRLDAGALLPTIRVPTLALFGIRKSDPDPDAKRRIIAEQFRRNRASPSVAVGFIEPATHSIWETAPDAFDAAVDAFVEALPGIRTVGDDSSRGGVARAAWPTRIVYNRRPDVRPPAMPTVLLADRPDALFARH